MKKQNQITTLFLDIGGVLLNNGWDHNSRQESSKLFHLDQNEMEERHHLNFETYELGKMTLDEYLHRVIFYTKRDFSRDEFKTFMYEQSMPHSEVIKFMIQLKKEYGLKIGVISNEGFELNEYRIREFKLNEFVDFFISSSFVSLRKPDADIFKLALNVAQVKPEDSIFIDNERLFLGIAQGFGMKTIWHKDLQSTVKQLEELGLPLTITYHG